MRRAGEQQGGGCRLKRCVYRGRHTTCVSVRLIDSIRRPAAPVCKQAMQQQQRRDNQVYSWACRGLQHHSLPSLVTKRRKNTARDQKGELKQDTAEETHTTVRNASPPTQANKVTSATKGKPPVTKLLTNARQPVRRTPRTHHITYTQTTKVEREHKELRPPMRVNSLSSRIRQHHCDTQVHLYYIAFQLHSRSLVLPVISM